MASENNLAAKMTAEKAATKWSTGMILDKLCEKMAAEKWSQ